MSSTTAMPSELVIAAYGKDAPCTMQLVDDCPAPAAFMVRLLHQDGTLICGGPEWTPFCAEHTKALKARMTGFWAELSPADPCSACGQGIALGEVRPL